MNAVVNSSSCKFPGGAAGQFQVLGARERSRQRSAEQSLQGLGARERPRKAPGKAAQGLQTPRGNRERTGKASRGLWQPEKGFLPQPQGSFPKAFPKPSLRSLVTFSFPRLCPKAVLVYVCITGATNPGSWPGKGRPGKGVFEGRP